MNTQEKNDTLFGGREIEITHEDGATASRVSVRQLKLKDYEAAFRVQDDEFALIGIICGKTKEFIETLAPESYERVLAVAQEVNASGFFVYAVRRNLALMAKLSAMPPQVLEAAVKVDTSSQLSPKLRPRPV